MEISVFFLRNRGIGISSKREKEILFLRDILQRSGREWKEETVKEESIFSFLKKEQSVFSADTFENGMQPVKMEMILPLRDYLEKKETLPNFSFKTYAVEDTRADLTAQSLVFLPGKEKQEEGIRFEILGMGLIGRIYDCGVSETEVTPLLGAACGLLSLGFPFAEMLELINRKTWAKTVYAV